MKSDKVAAFKREVEVSKKIAEATVCWSRPMKNTHVNSHIEENRKRGHRVERARTLSELDGDWS
jgi:hypothetical protein